MNIYKNGELIVSAQEDIMCMANLLGKDVRVPKPIPFSFYFSTKNSSHGLRVKPVFNPEKMSADAVGTLKLCDDWQYTPGKYDTNVDSKSIRKMKAFFRRYKVLFAAVWSKQLQETTVTDYFRGFISLTDLIKSFEFYSQFESEMGDIDSIEELALFVQENDLFPMFD